MNNTSKTERNAQPHMGRMVRNAVHERKMSICDFAKAICCSRTNVYSIFNRQLIDIERLQQIADVLQLEMSNFIMLDKRELTKCVAVVETDYETLERLSGEHGLVYVKYWKLQ